MTRSEALFEAAQKVLPGGVNSPVRACRAVGTYPRFLEKGAGSRVWDADGNEYIDLICSWGPLILGHCNAEVEQAVQAAKMARELVASGERVRVQRGIAADALRCRRVIRFGEEGSGT